MERKVLKNLCVMILLCLVSTGALAEWGIIGAGNATCKNWNMGNHNVKTEILSWMAGFASAQNLNFASENQPEYRLELLTYEHLTNSINGVCNKPENSQKHMSVILFGVLKDFPRVNAK
jgi:hypothetical protein